MKAFSKEFHKARRFQTIGVAGAVAPRASAAHAGAKAPYIVQAIVPRPPAAACCWVRQLTANAQPIGHERVPMS